MGAPPDPRVDDQAPLSREVEGWAQQYGPALRRYFQKKVNATEAEDLVQNVFLNIQSRGAQAGAIENVEGYLFRTAANVLARRLGRDAWRGDPLTAVVEPQDSARVFIPNGDQIIGGGLERITVNREEAQPVFDDVAQTLTEEAQPVLEALAALGA